MAEQSGDSGGGSSPLEQLREQLMEYLGASGKQVVGKVTDKLTDLADPGKLKEAGGGDLASTAARAMKGENPVKAMVSEKAKSAKDKVAGKAKEAVGMGGGSKAGDLKAINIIEHVDIGRPLRVVYNHFTQFEDFGSFMNGVSSVSRDEEDETKTTWKVRVWPSTRSYEATVSEQLPDQRIVWSSEGSKGTTNGAVSFHRLDENLTRVAVVVEYYPSGFFEKTGNIWRAQGRRLRLDLKHFQRYVTLQSDEVDGWRGEIRDGEVARSHDDVVQQEEEEEKERREREESSEHDDGEGREPGEDDDENADESEDDGDDRDEDEGEGEDEGDEFDDEDDEEDDDEDDDEGDDEDDEDDDGRR
ncbi:SRPBCC family protein [Streptomyces tubbatahanensis]|uniref:SRPBCC family protein n=1 Tax=Streptomyces tubbatahanensis TaxID=2923272 RepID=A0ABY3XN32_9ACTN|nr:SRPBCC family protein [Streptomyces tubbatahanensis]UNS95852.1 SRPBCC family protein [Streptomyces tubbatahanensis]